MGNCPPAISIDALAPMAVAWWAYLMAPLAARQAKVLSGKADNTLWGGVLGKGADCKAFLSAMNIQAFSFALSSA